MEYPSARTPDRRILGLTTDDAAIFIDDTIDAATAQCITDSPSALAILSPQRRPNPAQSPLVNLTDYDRLGVCAHSPLVDVTNAVARLSFGKSPTPSRASRSWSAARPPPTVMPATRRSTSRRASGEVVSMAELERVEAERNRFMKMYEHQKLLYEDMAEKQANTYLSLQEKIVEVVALSTRNEESKRFIRQLKSEMSESRSRVMSIQNRALEESRAERTAKARYESLVEEYERTYASTVERLETRMAGMDSLMRDLTCLDGQADGIHVAQLDALLKAAYTKSTALFSDLVRQGRQIDMLQGRTTDLEQQLDQLRRDKRESEALLREERRRMAFETERFIEQIEEQQQSILSLRSMLIRTLDTSSMGVQEAEEEEEELHDGSTCEGDGECADECSASSSLSSVPRRERVEEHLNTPTVSRRVHTATRTPSVTRRSSGGSGSESSTKSAGRSTLSAASMARQRIEDITARRRNKQHHQHAAAAITPLEVNGGSDASDGRRSTERDGSASLGRANTVFASVIRRAPRVSLVAQNGEKD